MSTITDLIEKLPPDLQKEVKDFAEFLVAKRTRKQGHKLRQDWAGALKEFRGKYDSLELQEKSMDWRGQ
ncbi:MAG: DUF2281 domain-containing protein [Deltaproteobacteria bacterium]|nr:DUF2281 domain-containing protein [Deltaproteobacteria bacterium]MBW1928995.1 DUF2281 domain-containing protein [Deltaproteobacteria bacterium]MBW2025533.1 DUF2281 domain-containing protein [Deltaproteobacteria bacterium]MBW2126086.1 DUF2281 domain-containing protein [Deltaproteobacteria bacterium]